MIPVRNLNAFVFFDGAPANAPSGSSVKRVAVYGANFAVAASSVPTEPTVTNVVVEGMWLGMDLNQSPGSNLDANNTGSSVFQATAGTSAAPRPRTATSSR